MRRWAPALLALLLLALLAQDQAHAKKRKRSRREGSADRCEGAASVRLRAGDRCEPAGAAAGLAATVQQPAPCGTLVLFTRGGADACSALAGASAARCLDVHSAFAAGRAQVGSGSSSVVGFLVIDERTEPQLVSWAQEYGARAVGDPPAVWWVPRSRGAAAAAAAKSSADAAAAERAFLRGYELADAHARSAAGLSAHFNSYCQLNLPLPRNQAPLLSAISQGDAAQLQRLIQGGMTVHPRGPTGTEECLEDSWEQMCYHPLLEAFREAQGPSDLELIRPLLTAGADIHVRGSDGSTVMHNMLHNWAEIYVHEDIPAESHPKHLFLKWLIDNSPIDNGAVDKYGQTLFHLAAGKHNYHMLKWMLSAPKMKGVDIDAKDVASNTALHFAAGSDYWYPAMSKSLMFTPDQSKRHYINFNSPAKYAGWDNHCLDNFRETASASKGNATNFLNIAAALNAPNCQFFQMPVKLLLEHGSKAVNVQNLAGETPLHRVCYTCDVQTLKLLLDAGADPTIRASSGLGGHGHTPAMLAMVLGCQEFLPHLPPLTAAEQELLLNHETPRMLAGNLVGQQVCSVEEAAATATADDASADSRADEMAEDVAGDSSRGAGWWDHEEEATPRAGSAEQLSVSDCEIAVRHAENFTAEEFERDFLALRRPVAVIGGALSSKAKAHKTWRRESFVERYGHMDVAVAEIPYASSFGRGSAKQDERMSMQQYVEYMESASAGDEYPKCKCACGTNATHRLCLLGVCLLFTLRCVASSVPR